jgi:alkylation response protein AidB-like acyl-CoA dehydrogenase
MPGLQQLLAVSQNRRQGAVLMSDNQTLLDMVEDLQIELTVARAEQQYWRNIAHKLYNPWTHMEGVDMYQKARHD